MLLQQYVSSQPIIALSNRLLLSSKHSEWGTFFSTTRPTNSVLMPTPTHESNNEGRATLMSFHPGSAGGIDSLWQDHLKVLTCRQTAEAGRRFNQSLADLYAKLLNGVIPLHVRNILFSAKLTALRKKDGDVCPIAVDNALRRLASKIAVRHVMPSLRDQLSPAQLGVGFRGGCEADIKAYSLRSRPSSPVWRRDGAHKAENSQCA